MFHFGGASALGCNNVGVQWFFYMAFQGPRDLCMWGCRVCGDIVVWGWDFEGMLVFVGSVM